VATKKQWIHAQSVTVNTGTGELHVHVGGEVTVKRKAISAAGNGDNQLVALVADTKIKVLALCLIAAEAVTATLYSGAQATGTALTGAIPLAANGGFVLPAPADPDAHWLETLAGKNLNLFLSAAKQVSGCLLYFEEA